MNTTDKEVISAILSEDSWTQGNFRINPYTNKLQYKIEKEIVITIDNSSEEDRASKGSDLLKELKLRNYNLLDNKGINPASGELGFISEYDMDGCASRFEVISNVITDKNIEKFTTLQSDLLNMQVGYIPNKYLDDGTGDYSAPEDYSLRENYYNFRIIKDFIQKSTVVNILTMNELTYTDTVNLNVVKSIDLSNKDDSMSIRMGVQYTKKDSDIVYTKELMFSINSEFRYSINDDVEIEFLDNCIRLFPMSDDIVECIISYCHLYYERIV